MKKILFALSALVVCFVALPEIKKAIRRIARSESILVVREINAPKKYVFMEEADGSAGTVEITEDIS
jgi:hypothetical protein